MATNVPWVSAQQPMSTVGMPLPPLKIIATALRETTEILAQELACPTARVPDWNPFEWRMARAAAVIHGVSPLLSTRLRWSGPDGWGQFLHQQQLEVAQRHQRIEQHLQHIDSAARQAGIAVLALKGAALHRLGYCQVGERPMGDIDLLVRQQDLATATQLVLRLGYRETGTSWRHKIFEPVEPAWPVKFGEQANLPIKIEVHTKVAERLPWNETDITARLHAGATGVGLNVYSTIDAVLLHQLLHAAGNMSSRWLRMLQLHDIATVARRMTSADWDRLLINDSAIQQLWWAYPPLKLTARYFPGVVPVGVLSTLAKHCPWLLRTRADRYRLSDVSSSSLWVSAVPAAAWAASVPELCCYLWRRLRPIPEEMEAISNFTRTQSWAVEGAWYYTSQWQRVLRWVFSRPARPQILQAVRLAQQSV